MKITPANRSGQSDGPFGSQPCSEASPQWNCTKKAAFFIVWFVFFKKEAPMDNSLSKSLGSRLSQSCSLTQNYRVLSGQVSGHLRRSNEVSRTFQICLKVCTTLSAPDPSPSNVKVAHHLVRHSWAFALSPMCWLFFLYAQHLNMQHSLKTYPSTVLRQMLTRDLNSECFLRSFKKTQIITVIWKHQPKVHPNIHSWRVPNEFWDTGPFDMLPEKGVPFLVSLGKLMTAIPFWRFMMHISI